MSERLDVIRKASALPPHIRLQVDPAFEKESIDIQVRAASDVEVDEALKKLESPFRDKAFSGAYLNLPTVRQAETKGSIVRDCPGTRGHICCGYKTIDLVEGCPLSCSYCILRGYLNSTGISVHRDTGRDHRADRKGRSASRKQHVLRFGTGELSDCLALDRRLDLNRPIVQFFGGSKGPSSS